MATPKVARVSVLTLDIGGFDQVRLSANRKARRDRRLFNVSVLGSLCSLSWYGQAQTVKNVPVVGVLTTDASNSLTLPAFVEALRDLGYTDGKNVVIDVRSARGKSQVLPGLAMELVQRKPDVVYATGPAPVGAMMAATRMMPIVALDLESDPIHAGWAQSLARPGGNLTGLFLDLPAMAGKWLELLHQAVPSARRGGLLWDSTTGSASVNAAKLAAKVVGVEPEVMELRDPDDLVLALEGGLRARVSALVQLSAPSISLRSNESAAFVIKHRLPAISPFRRFAEAGGLLSYGPDRVDMSRRAATYVDKILKGAKPGDLAIEQPALFELVLNLNAARELGITVPVSLLLRADKVIE